ncbi:hypothetical protein C8Q76DRAFT_618928 [Earliella scabrosa]|nr:hypothetical protein C8Q76DRAFT_618928 [Earliella scabrosa]
MGYAPQYDYAAGQWQLYCSYADPEYHPPYQAAPFHGLDHGYQPHSPSTDLPLHAPVPVSTYSSLLAENAGSESTSTTSHFPSRELGSPVEDTKPLSIEHENPLDVYLDAPQVLIPTPSELLTDLSSRESGAASDGDPAVKASPKRTPSGSSGKAKRGAREKPDTLNQRKAYFRSVSDNVGFTITDPDSITSHDKKRSYLECLEEYVQWLHEQIHLVGHKPVTLERISTYRGLKNRSLRTILVHNQNTLYKLNMQKLEAEAKYMELEKAVEMMQAAEGPLPYRRHSIALGALPHGVVSHL